MTIFGFILLVLACICVGAVYTVFGYKVTELFTDSPRWKPWEQALFWLFWPVIIPLFLIASILFIVAGLLIPILFVIGIIVRLIRKLFKK